MQNDVDCIKPLIDEKSERLFGITSVQKVDETFDRGFIMRDAVISSENDVSASRMAPVHRE